MKPNPNHIAAMFVSDLHFSENPPLFRSVEPKWMETQESYVYQLRELQIKNQAPVIIAGDIFDKWNSSPKLIAAVIHWFKGLVVYAIPGNHDLPYHQHKMLDHSAYWCLVEAGVVNHLTAEGRWPVTNMMIHSFPYGFPVKPCTKQANSLVLDVALVHSYIWGKGTGHKDAADSQRINGYLESLKGYDLAVFGDNHHFFHWKSQKSNLQIWNGGSFMKRHSDETSHKPVIGMLSYAGEITPYYLNTKKDQYLDVSEELTHLEKTLEIDLSGFAEELSALRGERLNFTRIAVHYLNKSNLPDRVKTVIFRALGIKK